MTLKGILHITSFITQCEAFLGIQPHFAMWRWLFWLVSSFPGSAFLVMGVPESRYGYMLLDGTSPSLAHWALMVKYARGAGFTSPTWF